ncbi:MAG TPA: hypothetical protein VFW94_09810 [Candidatus Acidoferrales bacterium]|nr:hypothetical protein [Candidatus Acidoferrales bacterium]
MARKSILAPARTEKPAVPEPSPAIPSQPIIQEATPEPVMRRATSVKPSRIAKLHLGGYYNPDDPSVIAFQKLGIDLRKSQQEMIHEAIRDFVAKHEASRAFSN